MIHDLVEYKGLLENQGFLVQKEIPSWAHLDHRDPPVHQALVMMVVLVLLVLLDLQDLQDQQDRLLYPEPIGPISPQVCQDLLVLLALLGIPVPRLG